MAKSRRLPEEQVPSPLPPLTNTFAANLVELACQANVGLIMLMHERAADEADNRMLVAIGVTVQQLGTLAVALSRQQAIGPQELEAIYRRAVPWWDTLAADYAETLAEEANEASEAVDEAGDATPDASAATEPVDLDLDVDAAEETTHYGH